VAIEVGGGGKKEKNNSPMSKSIFVLFRFMLRALI
jgi:hypothetical protein